jgi:O-antigen ligase
MNLVFFLFIATIFSLVLGEYGQFPFGQTTFSVSLTDILLALSLFSMLIWKIAIKKDLSVPKIFFLIAGFWGAGFLSLVFSGNLGGIFYLLRFVLYSSVFYLAYFLSKTRILGFSEFKNLVMTLCVAVAVLGFIQLLLFPDLEVLSPYGYDPHKYRLFSTFLDPNFAGATISFGLILSLGSLLHSKTPDLSSLLKTRRIEIVTILILFISLVLTFSRSAYLMFFSAAIILFLFKKKQLLVPLLLIPLVLYFVFPRFAERIEGLITLDKSASERIYSWDKGVALFKINPLTGVGFNNIRDASADLKLLKTYSSDGGNSGSGVDSSLLFVLATTGVAGFVLFTVFLGNIFLKLIKKIKAGGKGLSLTMLSLFTGLLVNSFIINSLFFPALMVLWFSAAGLVYGLSEGEGEGS